MSTGHETVPYLRLGVNIDHVATIRNARGGGHPDPLKAALLSIEAGADGVTAHLREDRRHISDDDIEKLQSKLHRPLNLEMAATAEMAQIALRHKPHACCLVPEKRQELTTEGGLDVVAGHNHLAPFVQQLVEAGIRVSMFIDPDRQQADVSRQIGANVIEIHTGTYCEAVIRQEAASVERELERIRDMADYAHGLGLEVHAGHGLTFDSVGPIAELPQIVELNIGHFLIGEAIFSGLDSSIRRMRALMDKARAQAVGQKSA
ncbi:MAG: pyridoxine 5'-phosphate synthase [Hyphomicrobiaceae bacterium]|nr:pyridoxine 5'-phosphate synthase [Hyphomicrobiaceae bacterium]